MDLRAEETMKVWLFVLSCQRELMARAYSVPQLFNPLWQWIICCTYGWILSHVIHVAKAEWVDSHGQVIHSCIRKKKEAQVQWNVSIAARPMANRAWKTGRVTKRLFLGPGGETLGMRTRQTRRVLRSMWRQVEDTSLCQHAESLHGFRLLSWSPKSLSQ